MRSNTLTSLAGAGGLLLAAALFRCPASESGADKAAGGDRREVWSEPDRGLTCALSTDKGKYREGEPVLVHFALRNVGDRPLVIEAPERPITRLSPLSVYLEFERLRVRFQSSKAA